MYDNMWYRGSLGDDENSCRITGASLARSAYCQQEQLPVVSYKVKGLTVALQTSPINTGAANKDIVNDCEDAFTAYPSSISVLDLTIIEYCSFI